MKTLLHAARLRERLVKGKRSTDFSSGGRLFRIEGETIVAGGGSANLPGDAVAVPTEIVLLVPARLPLASHRRRLEAAAFAIEDRIAEPLDRVHIAVGPDVAPGVFIVAVVRHAAMEHWIDLIRSHGLPDAALMPDALLLPPPPEGHWAVAVAGRRALVRCGDGTGFATDLPQLPLLWSAGGRPPCIAASAGVPESLSAKAAHAPAAGDPTVDRRFDLRQGRYAPRRRAMSPLRRRVAIAAVAGIVAHGAIAAADTLALRYQAHVREGETRALLTSAQPGTPAEGDLLDVLPNLPATRAAASADRLLPILARVSAAIGPASLQRMDYDRQARRLTLYADPGDEPGLARSLATAGFTVRAGAGRVDVTGLGT